MKYEMKTWKLSTEIETSNLFKAIRTLADRYMSASRFDAPGNSIIEGLTGTELTGKQAKYMFLFKELELFGKKQMVNYMSLSSQPFSRNHYWKEEPEDKIPAMDGILRCEIKDYGNELPDKSYPTLMYFEIDDKFKCIKVEAYSKDGKVIGTMTNPTQKRFEKTFEHALEHFKS
ncbi:gp222 [Sphingomonas phage PAU]|uniref:gp222 n=1 Tax=Sphingomonas phage PAU TaxID=1150991 RepID=UPI000257337C|nr:gp222 [Sphingomonas phage PAU]AFF28220.1 gp222 [Sphingomonas phage PAU]